MTAPYRAPRDHVWRQSQINAWLQCGRALMLELSGVQPRRDLDGWAALIGDAVHVGIATVLRAQRNGELLEFTRIEPAMQQAFAAAVAKAQNEGSVTNPEGVAGAIARVTEHAELVAQLAADPRIAAVDWKGVEEPFAFTDAHGRRFTGTRDAWGVARARVRAFAADGVELVDLEPGDVVLVDWKTGREHAIDHVSRSLNVQLALYRTGLPVPAGARVRLFIGLLRDLERPKVIEGVPKRLTPINPEYAAALGIDMKNEAALEKSRQRPYYGDGHPLSGKPIPKRLDLINPAWEQATNRPKGPVFHEARIDWQTVRRTVADVIDAARLGIFPASGAANGQCRRCEFRTRCTHAALQPGAPAPTTATTTTTNPTNTKQETKSA